MFTDRKEACEKNTRSNSSYTRFVPLSIAVLSAVGAVNESNLSKKNNI